ncbi:hypothetical protein TNCV_2675361, partial [Trichonephila clavipes]
MKERRGERDHKKTRELKRRTERPRASDRTFGDRTNERKMNTRRGIT